MPNRKPHFLWVKSEFGAGTWGASLGPDAIRFAAMNQGSSLFFDFPATTISQLEETLLIDPDPDPTRAYHISSIVDVYNKICKQVKALLLAGDFPFIIAGDHSNAGGTIAGIKSAYPNDRLGVIWIDAHADMHSPYTSPSGNVHGMPLAAALDLAKLTEVNGVPLPEGLKNNSVSETTARHWDLMCAVGGIRPKIHTEDLVFIGLRDYEQAEAYRVKAHNIKHFIPSQINTLGLNYVVSETLKHLEHCDQIYVSFDIDSLDKRFVPGTGTPVIDGLNRAQAQFLLNAFWESQKLVAIEFTEINPLLDVGNQTAEIALECIEKLVYKP